MCCQMKGLAALVRHVLHRIADYARDAQLNLGFGENRSRKPPGIFDVQQLLEQIPAERNFLMPAASAFFAARFSMSYPHKTMGCPRSKRFPGTPLPPSPDRVLPRASPPSTRARAVHQRRNIPATPDLSM